MPSKQITGLTLFLELGAGQARFLCASVSRKASRGSDHSNPLSVAAYGEVESSRSLGEISELLSSKRLKPKNLILLLPRSEFEVSLFQLPDLDASDFPLLIANLVSESMESLDFTTDFLLHSRNDSDGKNALTWTLKNETLDEFRKEAKQSGLNLLGVTSHAIGSISLWRSLVKSQSPHAVIVTIANRSIDFSVVFNHEVTHIRTIPFPVDDLEQITSRLVSELQRTVLMTGDADETESTRVYLFGAPEQRKPIAEALTEEFEVPVSILNPIDNTEFVAESLTVSQSEEYAHLLGAAKACFFDKLDVDLVSPRRPETRTLPWRRITTWSAMAALLLSFGGFLLWDEAAKQKEEIAEKREQFDDLAIDARRVIEMKDELAAIRAWRSSEVIWLDELDALSKQLPPREQSLIRRISMTVGDNAESKIDLSVEVNDNSLVVGLENAIRNSANRVNSKRVSESADSSGEKWNFETSIRAVTKPPKLSFVENTQTNETESAVSETNQQGANVEQSKGGAKQEESPELVKTKAAGMEVNQ